ncbi:right-handed parallel beta-helix repeat-containing protein [Jiangella asiatica]|uniref:Right-handed parallel beta-helix repeat-containing protein n=1 Tax=Jiangella asiatica TaxID=2530372 RepID=A0A4R5DH17_9ACTN|nr:right-handed parallel beta-helix repeat-containing protein [Jiangella asiatica]TDE11144.1 right-handed parallel beta-helix repeat-containing protein [Jiangella asiatica]
MRTLRLALAAVLAATLGAGSAGPAGGVQGDGATQVYVSPDGDDAGTGSADQPFQSLERARDAVRELIAGGMTGDVVVRLGGGTYYLDEPLRLDERDSGRDGHQVVYTNEPGERPVVVGGRPINGWHPHTRDVWRAHVPEVAAGDWTFNQLFVGGERATLARSPNSGYYRAGSPNPVIAPEDRQLRFRYTQAEAGVVDSIADPRSVQVYVYGTRDWFSNTIRLESIDRDDRVATLTSEALQALNQGSHYRLEGFAEALDQPGEWYLDRDEGYVYYWPADTSVPLNRQTIVAPTVQDVFVLRGTSPDQRVHDVVVEGLGFDGSGFTDYFMETEEASSDETATGRGRVWNRPAERNRHGTVRLENSENVVLRDLEIKNAGFSGISIDQYSRGVTVTGNEIHEYGYHGVILTGVRAGIVDDEGAQVYDNRDHTIVDNHIHHGGRLVGHGSGIFINQSGDNLISHNHVHDQARYGIGGKGLIGSEMADHLPDTYDGPEITWENHFDLLTSRDNVISFNHIHNVLQQTEDGGAISFKGVGTGTVVDNNYIHHVEGVPGVHASLLYEGIYLDDDTSYALIENNIVHDVNGPGSNLTIYAKGFGNRITNNVLVTSTTGTSTVGIISGQWLNVPVREHQWDHNIIYAAHGPLNLYQFAGGWFPATDPPWVQASDHNLFYSPTGEYVVTNIPGDDTLANWRTLLDGRYDQNSVTADPLFVDPENHDYRLQPNSPALDLGFQPIDTEKIGLTDDFGRVQGLAVAANDPDRVDLAWQPVDAAASYRVAVSTRYEGPFRTVGETSDGEFRHQPTPAERSRPLYVVVSAVVDGVPAGHSAVLTVPPPVSWDTVVDEDFDDEPVGQPPAGWEVDATGGSVSVELTPDGDGHSLRLVDDVTGVDGLSATLRFEASSSRFRYTVRARADQADGAFLPRLTDPAGVLATEVGFAGNGALRYWRQRDPNAYTDIGPFEPGRWYTFTLDADVGHQSYDLFVDGAQVVDDAAFMNPVGSIDRLVLPARSQTGTYHVDFVTIQHARQG